MPIPKAKPYRNESLLGLWQMKWAGTGGTIYFGIDGDMINTMDGSGGRWRGYWKWEGRVLVLQEVFFDQEWCAPSVFKIEMTPVSRGEWKGRTISGPGMPGFEVRFFNHRDVADDRSGINP